MVKFEIITDNDGPNLMLSAGEPNWFMAKWIPMRVEWDDEIGKNIIVARSLPHDGQDVLASDGVSVWMDRWIEFGDNEDSVGFDSGEDCDGRYWMPLPTPPTERKGTVIK